jgi:hypothetical protein
MVFNAYQKPLTRDERIARYGLDYVESEERYEKEQKAKAQKEIDTANDIEWANNKVFDIRLAAKEPVEKAIRDIELALWDIHRGTQLPEYANEKEYGRKILMEIIEAYYNPNCNLYSKFTPEQLRDLQIQEAYNKEAREFKQKYKDMGIDL